MNPYGYDQYMRTHRKVDYHSLQSIIERAMTLDSYYLQRKHKAEYYHRYSDYVHRLVLLASYMWTESEHLAVKLGEEIPFRHTRFDAWDHISASGVAWFNIAISSIEDSNLIVALENEHEHGKLPLFYERDAWRYDLRARSARKNILERLPREKLLLVLGVVQGFVNRTMAVMEATRSLQGVINELEYQHNAIVQKDGTVIHHPATYL